MLTRKSAKTLVLGGAAQPIGKSKKQTLKIADTLLTAKGTSKFSKEKNRIKKRLDKLDTEKSMLVKKLKKVISKTKKGDVNVKVSGKKDGQKKEGATKGDKKNGHTKQQHNGKGSKKRPTSDALDKELDSYWIKKGETGTVVNHLDNEMDEYWKKANQP